MRNAIPATHALSGPVIVGVTQIVLDTRPLSPTTTATSAVAIARLRMLPRKVSGKSRKTSAGT
jgi:hypothetical protein